MKLFINIVMKRIYLFRTVSWNYEKENRFSGLQKGKFRQPSRAAEAGKELSCQSYSASHITWRAECSFHRPTFIGPALWPSENQKIEVASRVISATESELEELEHFHFLQTLLMTKWKPADCRSRKRKQKREDEPVTKLVPTLCDWFSSSASACDSDNLVFTRS